MKEFFVGNKIPLNCSSIREAFAKEVVSICGQLETLDNNKPKTRKQWSARRRERKNLHNELRLARKSVMEIDIGYAQRRANLLLAEFSQHPVYFHTYTDDQKLISPPSLGAKIFKGFKNYCESLVTNQALRHPQSHSTRHILPPGHG